MHRLLLPLAIGSAAIGSPVTASGHAPRQITDNPFHIQAYGDGVDQLTLFSSGEAAYLGDYTLVGGEAAPVIFTATDDGAWLGSPDASAFADSRSLPAWSALAFSVPKDAAGSTHDIGLVDPASSAATEDLITTGFKVYGTFVMVTGASGSIEEFFYAVPTGTDGVYALRWDSSGDDTAGQIAVALRTAETTAS